MNRRIALVAVAVALALVGTFAVYSYAHNADKRAVAKTHSVTVLVAQKSVPAGTSWAEALKGRYLQEQKVPVDSAPSSAILSLSASVPVGQVATAAIAAGQIVLRPAFGEKAASTGILAIPAGKLAVSVTMSGSADVAGFVQNGSDIAIFVTFETSPVNAPAKPAIGGKLYGTKLVLARVGVIATSQAPPGDTNGTKTAANGTGTGVLLTLALSQDEAERLILAQQIGQLYLALLSDTSVTAPGNGVTNTGVFTPTPVFVK
jgi:pilus assembly protein CpaB